MILIYSVIFHTAKHTSRQICLSWDDFYNEILSWIAHKNTHKRDLKLKLTLFTASYRQSVWDISKMQQKVSGAVNFTDAYILNYLLCFETKSFAQ